MSENKSAGPKLPAESKLKGAINGGIPEDQKVVRRNLTLDDGPKLSDRGGYEPGAYRTAHGNIRENR